MKNPMTVDTLEKGMSFEECLETLSDKDLLIRIELSRLCWEAEKIRTDGAVNYNVLGLLDALNIRGEKILKFIYYVADGDYQKVLIILWTYELGIAKNNWKEEVPKYASVEFVREVVAEKVEFPFRKGKRFIERVSDIRFPVEETE